SLKHLDLVPFQPYLARFARVRLRGGALSVHGTVSYRAGAQAPDLRFTGGMELDQLAVDNSVSHTPLLQLGTLAVDGLQYLGPSASLSIRKVLLNAPFAHIVVNPDHTTNLGNLVVSQPAGTHHAKRPPRPGTRPLSVNIGEIAVKGGHLGFADQSMQPQVQVGIENLRGNVTHFSTQPGHSASVNFAGDVGPYAPVTIKGTINPLAKALTADIGVQFRNLGLTAFSAYSGKFAGYRIKKGKANLTLDYAIHDGLMQGKNTVVLNQLELGEKVDSPDAVHLPLKLAIALLKNSDGVIDLDLPVHGDLNDPQFAIGPLIWKVVVNVLTKAVTSPFHLLASLVGLHGGNLGQLAFTPGQATLGTTDQKDLSALASAMQKRPNLTLDIAGTTAAPADRDALAQARLLARLQGSQATPAASTATAPPALTPDEQAGLLKAYRKAFDSDAQDAVKRTPSESRDSYRARVTRFALAKLVAREPITPAALQQLAQARAEAVRTYLVQHGGLDAERIFMVEPTAAGTIARGKVQMPLKLQVE
ncbi:MAG TPA: DUF748 domain-containing protein, partial [Nevskiaceae bacterium]|nr:DUF748 domain-containing protein [Nevskiaceae bacterium]